MLIIFEDQSLSSRVVAYDSNSVAPSDVTDACLKLSGHPYVFFEHVFNSVVQDEGGVLPFRVCRFDHTSMAGDRVEGMSIGFRQNERMEAGVRM